MPIFNRFTGEQATPEEAVRVYRTANDILDDPYAAPELQEWAMEILPADQVEARFWESVRHQAERRRREQTQQGA